MENKLTLREIAPYLPYGLIMRDSDGIYKEDRILIFENMKWMLSNGKPILRPLSDLFKLIDWDNNNDPYMIGYKYGVKKVKEDGVEFYADEYYADYCESPKCYIDITSFNWWLFEYHFDVFGLIEKGLAIDINTLK